MIKTVLIDDESGARETLRHQLAKYLPHLTVVGEADSVESGITLLEQTAPELVFLDIEMPLGSGFDILDATRHLKFQVIFITAFSQYALQAFKFSAAAYLMKPVRITELKEAVERVFAPSAMATSQQKLSVLSHNLSPQGVNSSKIVLLVTRTLKEYDDLLTPNGFLRIHQSHLVNLAFVKRYIRGKGGEVEMSDKAVLPLSRHKKDEFLKHFHVE